MIEFVGCIVDNDDCRELGEHVGNLEGFRKGARVLLSATVGTREGDDDDETLTLEGLDDGNDVGR